MLLIGVRSCTEPNCTLVGGSNEKLCQPVFPLWWWWRETDATSRRPLHGQPRSWGKVLSRSVYCWTLSRVHFEFTEWMTALPHWSSRSRTSSKLSRVNMDEASRIEDSSRPGAKDYYSFHVARDTRLSSVGPSTSISKILSSKDIFRSTSLHSESHPKQKDNRELHLRLDLYTWSLSSKQLTNSNPTQKNKKVPLANNTSCISFHFHVFY